MRAFSGVSTGFDVERLPRPCWEGAGFGCTNGPEHGVVTVLHGEVGAFTIGVEAGAMR